MLFRSVEAFLTVSWAFLKRSTFSMEITCFFFHPQASLIIQTFCQHRWYHQWEQIILTATIITCLIELTLTRTICWMFGLMLNKHGNPFDCVLIGGIFNWTILLFFIFLLDIYYLRVFSFGITFLISLHSDFDMFFFQMHNNFKYFKKSMFGLHTLNMNFNQLILYKIFIKMH